MALSSQVQQPAWHFWVRLLGLSGLLVLAPAGLMVYAATASAAGIVLATIGGLFAALALVVELTVAVKMAPRHGAVGSNVLVQVLLAILLLAGINVFSFFHYARLDWTRDREHTVAADPTVTADMRKGLEQLRGTTRIVVFQQHAAQGQLAAQEDSYAAAAERKIVAKVKDLAEEFQELGPRFHVEMLDRRQQDFPEKLDAIKQEAPKLAAAIDAAPESSIFFYADGKVQRLAFHDVYQLDRRASEEGRGNLVLRFQGRGPFARKVLNIEERRPRIAFAVIHEILGLENKDEVNKAMGMAGVKQALSSRGFDTRDIVLKKWAGEMGPPEPAVLTYDESRYERLDEELTELEATVKSRQEVVDDLKAAKRVWSTGSLADLNKRFVIVVDEDGDGRIADRAAVQAAEKKSGRKLRTAPISEQHRRQVLQIDIEPRLGLYELNLQHDRQERDALRKEIRGLNVEDLSEQRRITDLRAKLNRMLSDCDMLVVPRMTLFNVARGEGISGRLYRLDNGQVEAIKDFLKSGRPVLFCLGPSNEPPGRFDPRDAAPDRLEGLLTELGFKLPKQTILFNVETKSFGERHGALLILGGDRVEVPPVEFDWRPGGRPRFLKGLGKQLAPNPIRVSLRLAAQSAGKDVPEDLRLRHPRPVYYQPAGSRPAFDPVFLVTSPDAWNESDPFPTRERTPRYEPPKAGDPDRGTVRERRTGQFPIGVSAEVKVPASWGQGEGARPTARVALIGHGGVFMGPSLSPVREKLLLDVSNWLLGRDDLLARDSGEWHYPRVELSDSAAALWKWGALGMPLLFVYLGFVVLMVRRTR